MFNSGTTLSQLSSYTVYHILVIKLKDVERWDDEPSNLET